MKKQTKKISYDNIWALEKLSREQKLGSLDLAIRYLISFYEKSSQNGSNEQITLPQKQKETKNAKKTKRTKKV